MIQRLSAAGDGQRYLASFHLLGRGLETFGESSRLPVLRSLNQPASCTLLKRKLVVVSSEHGLHYSCFDR